MGQALGKVRLPEGTVVATIVRDGQPTVPEPVIRLRARDEFLLVPVHRDLGGTDARGSRVEGLVPAQEQSAQQPALGLGQQVPPVALGCLPRTQQRLVLGAQDAQLLLQQIGSALGDIKTVS